MYLKCVLSDIVTIVTKFYLRVGVVYKLPIRSTISFYKGFLSYIFLFGKAAMRSVL